MASPRDQTINSYKEKFSEFVERSPKDIKPELQSWLDYFLSQLPQNGKILELGSASGRDARYFRSNGFEVLCTDVVPEALMQLSEDGFETEEYDFRNEPKEEWLGAFDAVFANAVLLHATEEQFSAALFNISQMLKHEGIFSLSLLTGEGEEVSLRKIGAPRYFKYYTEESFREAISMSPFELLYMDTAEEGKWIRATLRNS